MNLAQSLGAAAAALVMGLSASGVAPAQTLSQVTAEVRSRLEPAAFQDAVEELASMLEHTNDPQHLAAQLSGELNSIHRDAHLRATLNGGSEPGRQVLRAPPGDKARAVHA